MNIIKLKYNNTSILEVDADFSIISSMCGVSHVSNMNQKYLTPNSNTAHYMIASGSLSKESLKRLSEDIETVIRRYLDT